MKRNRRKMDGSVARTSRKSEGLKDYRKVSRTGGKGEILEGKKRKTLQKGKKKLFKSLMQSHSKGKCTTLNMKEQETIHEMQNFKQQN